MAGLKCRMEIPAIKDFLLIRIRKGFIKEVTFEVDLEGLGGFGSFRISWKVKKLGSVGGRAPSLGTGQ